MNPTFGLPVGRAVQAHVDRLRGTPKVVGTLLTSRTWGMRLRDLLSSPPPPPPAEGATEAVELLALARARDPAAHRLYDEFASEAALQLAIAKALFAHHDGRFHRRNRYRNVALGSVAFVFGTILDFAVSNV